jgi:wyosine [tRNA(Phe)-imidazoG37] synthetase (radical SAM superfamily)
MPHVFGPVPSRRLGRSLGVDPLPFKTCNWNCIYCQLGRSCPLTARRIALPPARTIVEEVRAVIGSLPPGSADWLTFVGSGEPTLHARLGWMIRQVKTFTRLPVAVITNGSTLYQGRVRRALYAADAVLPSLDAGSETAYRAINRPHPSFTFDRLVQGLLRFRSAYRGMLWIEVMLLRSINDSEHSLRELAALLLKIRPDEIHLSLPLRPPAESWVQPATTDALDRARAILGATTRVLPPIPESAPLAGTANLLESILAIIARHPMEEDQLLRALGRWHPGEAAEALHWLATSGRAQAVQCAGRRFWCSPHARFGREC